MATKKPKKGKPKKKAKNSPAKLKKSAKKRGKSATKKKKQARKKGKGKPGEGSTGPKFIDWPHAKRLYITSSRYITHEELVEHLKNRDGKPVECNVSNIHRRAARENWARQRKEYIAGVTEDFLKVIGERYVLTKRQNLDALSRIKDLMLEVVFDPKKKIEIVAVADILAVMKAEMAYYGEADFTVRVPEKNQSGVEHVKKALLSALKGGKMTREQLRKAVTK